MHKSIVWVCREADRLADSRNNIAHVAYAIDLDRTLSDVEITPRGKGVFSRADTMNKRDIFEELHLVEENSKALFQFAILLAPVIAYPEMQEALPKRPALLLPMPLPTRSTPAMR